MIKNITYLLGGLGVLILYAGCADTNSNQSGKIDYSLLSMEFCNCAARSIELNDQMRRYFESDQTEKIDQLAPIVSKEFKTAINCCTKVKSEQAQSGLDKKKLKKKLLESCPEMPSKLIEDLLRRVN